VVENFLGLEKRVFALRQLMGESIVIAVILGRKWLSLSNEIIEALQRLWRPREAFCNLCKVESKDSNTHGPIR
jgi:hypothetical protein